MYRALAGTSLSIYKFNRGSSLFLSPARIRTSDLFTSQSIVLPVGCPTRHFHDVFALVSHRATRTSSSAEPRFATRWSVRKNLRRAASVEGRRGHVCGSAAPVCRANYTEIWLCYDRLFAYHVTKPLRLRRFPIRKTPFTRCSRLVNRLYLVSGI